MMDVLGKVVFENVVGEIKKIDVFEFKNGVYLVMVFDGNKVLVMKWVVVKY